MTTCETTIHEHPASARKPVTQLKTSTRGWAGDQLEDFYTSFSDDDTSPLPYHIHFNLAKLFNKRMTMAHLQIKDK